MVVILKMTMITPKKIYTYKRTFEVEILLKSGRKNFIVIAFFPDMISGNTIIPFIKKFSNPKRKISKRHIKKVMVDGFDKNLLISKSCFFVLIYIVLFTGC